MTLKEHQELIEKRIVNAMPFEDRTLDKALWLVIEKLHELDSIKMALLQLKQKQGQ